MVYIHNPVSFLSRVIVIGSYMCFNVSQCVITQGILQIDIIFYDIRCGESDRIIDKLSLEHF